MKMARRASTPDDERIRVILDGVSFIRDADGVWYRVTPFSADDVKENWFRASPSLLIRRPDNVGKVMPVKAKEQ